MKKRTGDPWIPAKYYGTMLPAFNVNLVVRSRYLASLGMRLCASLMTHR